MGVSKKYLSRHTTRALVWLKQSNVSKNVPVIIRNVSWQIRYTEPGKTGAIARSMGSGYQVQNWADQVLQQKLIKNKNIRIIPIESKWSAPSDWANAAMVWAALPQNRKKRSWLLSHYLYSWRICSGFRGEYFVLFCICSNSVMTGTDARVGSCRYLLNQQTLIER